MSSPAFFFFSFVVASFLFAVTSGDNTVRRASIDSLLASMVFSIALVQMFLALVWFFMVSKWLRIISPEITIAVAVYFGVVVNSPPDWSRLVFPVRMTYLVTIIMGMIFPLCELAIPDLIEE